MLVLSRQRDESIMIGDNIVVTIVDIRGDKVRLGINAPTEIPVHRQEIYEAIQRENVRASRVEPNDTRGLGRGGNKPPGPPPSRGQRFVAGRPASDPRASRSTVARAGPLACGLKSYPGAAFLTLAA